MCEDLGPQIDPGKYGMPRERLAARPLKPWPSRNVKGYLSSGMYRAALSSNVARDSGSTDYQRVRISHEKKHEMSSTMITTTEHNWMFISRSGVGNFREKISAKVYGDDHQVK